MTEVPVNCNSSHKLYFTLLIMFMLLQ